MNKYHTRFKHHLYEWRIAKLPDDTLYTVQICRCGEILFRDKDAAFIKKYLDERGVDNHRKHQKEMRKWEFRQINLDKEIKDENFMYR